MSLRSPDAILSVRLFSAHEPSDSLAIEAVRPKLCSSYRVVSHSKDLVNENAAQCLLESIPESSSHGIK